MNNSSSTPGAVEIAGPPTPGLVPSSPSDEIPKHIDHLSYNIIGVTCMLLILCLIAVAGRLKARRMTKASLGVDDYFALIALVLLIALSIQQFYLAHHLLIITQTFPPSPGILRNLAKLEVASQINYVLLLTAARSSILFLYRRIFTLVNFWFCVAWYSNTFFVIGFCISTLISLAFECAPKPLSTLWDSPIDCKTSHSAPIIIGFVNAVVDLFILILPIRMVWILQLSARKKLAVCGIFGLGSIGVAVSIARAVAFTTPTISSPRGGAIFAIWSITEAAVALLCACIPLLRPIFTTAYNALSTFRANTISSFGLQDGSPKSSRKTYGEHHGAAQEDDIPMWPTSPAAAKRSGSGISSQSPVIRNDRNIHEV